MLSHLARLCREPQRLESLVKKLGKQRGGKDVIIIKNLVKMMEPTEELYNTQHIDDDFLWERKRARQIQTKQT